MPVLTKLPDPTWTESENNLLPKWRRYLEWHNSNYGTDELVRARNRRRVVQSDIDHHLGLIQGLKRDIAGFKERRKEYLNAEAITDDMIRAQYHELIASPHVAGTAIGMSGELRVLIDPQIEGYENIEFGLFELSYRTSGRQLSFFQVKFYEETYYPLVHNLRSERVFFGSALFHRFDVFCANYFDDQVRAFNLRFIVDNFIDHVIRQYAERFTTKKTDDRELAWSGHNVLDPVRALKMFMKKSSVDTAADHVERFTKQIKECEHAIAEYNSSIRSWRKTVRSLDADIAKVEAALKKDGNDDDELVEMLRSITTMPGVIGIRFNRSGTPVLHVRCSFVHEGKRYDLGDYELNLITHCPDFGEVLKVERTRAPAGGEYTQGWHEGRGFCFGNRTDAILTAFKSGDFTHAVNVALGTMNTINDGHIRTYRFAEIPMNMVWNRQIRQRRRRRSATAKAMGATALAAAS